MNPFVENDSILKSLSAIFKKEDPLLLFTLAIGPVQDFIAEARKVSDLWAGSHIISEIGLSAILPIVEIYGSTDPIIYPSLKNQTRAMLQSASLSNQFTAIIKKTDLKYIIETSNSNINNKIEELREITLISIKQIAGNYFDNAGSYWADQLGDAFDLTWVAIPINLDVVSNAGLYAAKFSEMQSVFQSRKMTRTFRQWNGAPIEKCSQCGHREIIFPPSGSEELWSSLARANKLKQGEKLCFLCAAKRLYSSKHNIKFESTRDTSVRTFREELLKEPLPETKLYLECINNIFARDKQVYDPSTVPSDLLYQDGLTPAAFATEHGLNVQDIIAETENAIRYYKSITDHIGIPSKYYGILVLDGDEIGKWMSGAKLPEKFSMDWQADLSFQLSTLARNDLANIVGGDWNGMLIYSGGDDVLAVGPLSGLLECANKINTECFSGKGHFPSLSGGIVIAHFKDSLKLALNSAREAVKAAKANFDRNAVVITLRFSSGTIEQCGYKWNIGNGSKLTFLNSIEKLAHWISAKKGRNLGVGFIHDLLEIIPAFYKWNGREWFFENNTFKAEAERLLRRHIPDDIAPTSEESIDALLAALCSVAETNQSRRWKNEDIIPYENLNSFLHIAAFLAREYKSMEAPLDDTPDS